jgi:hypothetical protein
VESAFEELAFQRRVAKGFEALEIVGLVRIEAGRGQEEIAQDVLVEIDRSLG